MTTTDRLVVVSRSEPGSFPPLSRSTSPARLWFDRKCSRRRSGGKASRDDRDDTIAVALTPGAPKGGLFGDEHMWGVAVAPSVPPQNAGRGMPGGVASSSCVCVTLYETGSPLSAGHNQRPFELW